jgi:hypothetical protein
MHPHALLLLLAVPLAAATAPAPSVQLTTLPEHPWVEYARQGQRLNFDLVLDNPGSQPLELAGIELSVHGAGGELLTQRRLGTNGDSIATVPNRMLPAGGRLVVFNPFVDFDPELDLSKLRYDLTFVAGEGEVESHVQLTVEPRRERSATRLVLPIRTSPDGALHPFVHDGHDFYSHHRRLDITGGMTTALGIRTNMGRYAYDFCLADESGRLYRGDGSRNEDWFGWGAPILAPGDGVVRESRSDIADNRKDHPVPMEMAEVMKNLKRLFGNYVLIDHGNGEHSLLAHLQQGSVSVKPGDVVRAGQPVGRMGMSGDAFLVHLHYQLQSDASFGEGVPSYFENVRLRTGAASWIPIPGGQVDSGDVLDATP